MALTEENVVFILGAGASVPYGYPTGFQLSHEIKIFLQNMHNDKQLWGKEQKTFFHIFDELGYGLKQLQLFYECFLGAAVYSVDKFLERRPDHEELGKLLIAYFLKRKENPHNLLIKLQEDNWYAELFNRLNITIDNVAYCRISFLTFNYDRSLEVFLHSILKNRTTKCIENVIAAMESLHIVHVYGSLGNQPWAKSKGIAYDYTVLPDQLKSMAEGIEIMSSERETAKWERAHELLFNATHIYFLGFGYDETNLKRLRIRDYMKGKTIRGTAVGIKHSRRSEILRFFDLGEQNSIGEPRGSYLKLEGVKVSIMDFLESTVVFRKN